MEAAKRGTLPELGLRDGELGCCLRSQKWKRSSILHYLMSSCFMPKRKLASVRQRKHIVLIIIMIIRIATIY